MFKGSLAAAVLAVVLVACTQATFNIQPDTLPSGTVGQPYEALITATYPEGGDVALKSLSIESGSLAPGLSLRSTDSRGGAAAIFGTPTAAGTYQFRLRVGGEYCTMSGCPFGLRDYTLVVAP